MTKKTLLQAVREYGIFEVKDVIAATGQSRQTLSNWLNSKPRLLELVLKGMKFESLNK
jgi:hypothetical protein